MPFTFYCHTSGNNTDPVKRGLLCRGWREGPPPAKNEELYNGLNFIWKPTWHHMRGCPLTFTRANPNPARRQMINHHRGVEPLWCGGVGIGRRGIAAVIPTPRCSAKDDIFNTLNSHYLALGIDPFTRIPATYLIEPKKADSEEWPGWAEFAGAAVGSVEQLAVGGAPTIPCERPPPPSQRTTSAAPPTRSRRTCGSSSRRR